MHRDGEGRNSIFAFFPYHVFVCVNSVYSVCLVHSKNQRHHKGNKVEYKAYCSPASASLKRSALRLFKRSPEFWFSLSQITTGGYAWRSWLIITTPNKGQDIELFS